MSEHPTCPYAYRGLDGRAMRSCPSFVAAEVGVALTVTGGLAAGTAAVRGVFCAHLGLQESRRTFGYTSACTHPQGPPSVATIEVTGRRVNLRPALTADLRPS